jgi:uncharacterized membrane protein YphA (DoxX/SURF4 family)
MDTDYWYFTERIPGETSSLKYSFNQTFIIKTYTMKIAVIIVRTLMGLMFAFASIAYFLKLMHEPEATGSVKIFNDGIVASVYLMPTVKIFELLCAIAFLSGRFVSLAAVLIFPIILNILLFHSFLQPSGIPLAVLLLLGDLFLAYYYRDRYKAIFAAK